MPSPELIRRSHQSHSKVTLGESNNNGGEMLTQTFVSVHAPFSADRGNKCEPRITLTIPTASFCTDSMTATITV